LNFRRAGDATAVGVGLGDISAVVFLRTGRGVGEIAAGDSAVEGEAVLSTVGVVSAFFCARCFAGEVDSFGVPVSSCDSTCVAEIVRPIANRSRRILRVISSTCLCSACR
jgi:hypothetical protein